MSDGGFSAPIFIADQMLGSLARWLRMLGYDTLYERDLTDDEIVEMAEREGRTILTRDRSLASKGAALLISSTSLDDQLLAVKNAFHLTFQPEKLRCSVCNGALMKIDFESATGEVPQRSLNNCTELWRCQRCQKIYWDGSHWNGILKRFERLKLMEEKKE